MLAGTRPDLDSHLSGFAALLASPAVKRRSTGLAVNSTIRNGLLAALPEDALARLRPLLEPVELKRKQILHERNVPIPHAYFIERGTASMLSRSGEHGAVEIGTVGRGDLVGLAVVLGATRSPHRCVVQVPGSALRIATDNLKRAFDELPCFRNLLLAHVQAVMTEGTQLVVCNTRHRLKERLARWLLVAHDRLDGDEIPLTHESLSRAIAVRRAGVTVAVGQMEDGGIVRLGRGRLTILDRPALERTSCECYRIIRAEHRRMLCS